MQKSLLSQQFTYHYSVTANKIQGDILLDSNN